VCRRFAPFPPPSEHCPSLPLLPPPPYHCPGTGQGKGKPQTTIYQGKVNIHEGTKPMVLGRRMQVVRVFIGRRMQVNVRVLIDV